MIKVTNIKIFSVFVLISILLNTKLVISNASSINFENIRNEDGLSQSTAETIIQDKKGYIWIGTNDGLNRYNGHEFKIYRHSSDEKNSIANNYIVDLQEDNNGYIWVGTASGLSKINTKNNQITNYFSSEDKGNLSNNNIGDILITKDNKVVIGTSGGLNIYDEKEDKFLQVLSGSNDLTSQCIRTLAEDEYGDIWIATEYGLNKIDISEKKVEKFYSTENENSLSGNSLYGLYYDDSGYIWVGTYNAGLNQINIKTNEIKRYVANKEDPNALPSNYIRDIFKDNIGRIWLATDKGLCELDSKYEKFIRYTSNIYDRNSLASDDIFTIIQDRSGLIWVGTYSGISVFDTDTNIKHYKSNPVNDNSLTENIIHGIYEDKDGLVWVGTNSEGLNVIDQKNDKIYHLSKENSNGVLDDNRINDIQGKGNEIYIATNNGITKIDKDKNTVDKYGKDQGIKDNNIRTLFLDSKGYLWIGTPIGLNILNTKTEEIIDIDKHIIANGIKNIHPKVIYEDTEGIYWLGCFIGNGLLKIDPNNNIIKQYKNIKNNETSISSNTIRSINEDLEGNIWIGTSYGLNKFDKKTKEFTRYTTNEGLANNIVYGILIDENNDLWSSTNKGISKLNSKSNTFENFSITDGLQGNEFNGNAAYKSRNGTFYFGGINGLNVFHPSDVAMDDYTPDIEFDSFKINGKEYENIDGLKLKYNENFININIFFPDYSNLQNVKYYYVLEGANEHWSEVESNDINYSNLSPGNYTLKIKARSYNGCITSENKVSFIIEPPFYKSDLAIIIYFLLTILIIYSYINRMKYLDRLVSKKTEQLSKEMELNNELLNKVIQLERNKNNYFINLSHELRTPLNVIYTTEQLITELNKSKNNISKDKLSQYMDVMRRNTKRLLRLINNLIDTTKIEHGNYKISMNKNDIVYVVEEATLSLKEYIEAKGIELIIDPEIEEKIITCDKYEIERCIVNLVSNAVKFTPSGGKIQVRIEDLKDKVKISVEDNGEGIDSKYHKTIFDRFNQIVDPNSEVKGGSGLGLAITKHIIELHDGEIYVESELGKGSKFIIIL